MRELKSGITIRPDGTTDRHNNYIDVVKPEKTAQPADELRFSVIRRTAEYILNLAQKSDQFLHLESYTDIVTGDKIEKVIDKPTGLIIAERVSPDEKNIPQRLSDIQPATEKEKVTLYHTENNGNQLRLTDILFTDESHLIEVGDEGTHFSFIPHDFSNLDTDRRSKAKNILARFGIPDYLTED